MHFTPAHKVSKAFVDFVLSYEMLFIYLFIYLFITLG